MWKAAGIIALGLVVTLVPISAMQSSRDPGCPDWRECRQMALAAADRGDFEAFHDLAWRAVQLGPSRDTALLLMLARAQAVSGRPHDALVMLDRLAELGVASDAETSDDFVRTRELPGWPDVAAHIERVKRPSSPPASATTSAPAAAPPARRAGSTASTAPPAAAAAAAAVSVPRAPVEAVRFSAGAFTPGGLAYDAVSGRFLFGDRLGRKLFVVSERSNRATDFVRGEPAGIQEVAAIEVDAKRGDLWVASTASGESAGSLHKLQLISGRALRSFPIDAGAEPVSLADLAVTAGGAVLVLDSGSRQLLELRPGATALERVLRLDVQEPTSVAAVDERTAYVAHRDGVSRIDLQTRRTTPLAAPNRVSLDRLERIRWHDHALIAVRVDEDGSRRIIRFDVSDSRRAVVRAKTLEQSIASAGPIFVTFWEDELVYLQDTLDRATAGASADSPRPAEFVAFRLRLR